MSHSRVVSSDVICPYWLGLYEGLTIRCEGFVDGSEVRMCFKSRQARISYEKAFCQRQNYRHCPICRACKDSKYSDDEEDE